MKTQEKTLDFAEKLNEIIKNAVMQDLEYVEAEKEFAEYDQIRNDIMENFKDVYECFKRKDLGMIYGGKIENRLDFGYYARTDMKKYFTEADVARKEALKKELDSCSKRLKTRKHQEHINQLEKEIAEIDEKEKFMEERVKPFLAKYGEVDFNGLRDYAEHIAWEMFGIIQKQAKIVLTSEEYKEVVGAYLEEKLTADKDESLRREGLKYFNVLDEIMDQQVRTLDIQGKESFQLEIKVSSVVSEHIK